MKTSNKSKPVIIIQCYEDRQKTLPLRKTEHLVSNFTSNTHPLPKREATDSPPPPPPMPATNGQQNGEHKTLDNQKTISKSIITDITKTLNLKNGSLTRTPTPDYNKNNSNKTESTEETRIKNGKDEKVELESLESYKLKNPTSVQPKPPSNYFMRAPNGTATMKKHVRPVSVTIGEYTSGMGARKEPTKLDFLNGDKADSARGTEDVPLTNRLQSELALTLSRSNLRKKTEALVQVKHKSATDITEDSDSSVDKNFHIRYGNNLLPLPPSVTIPKVSKLKH